MSLKQKKATLVMAPGVEPDLEKIKETVLESGFKPGEATVRVITD